MSGEGMRVEKGTWDSTAVLLPAKEVSVSVGDLGVPVLKLCRGFVPQVVSHAGGNVGIGLTVELAEQTGSSGWKM